MKKIWIPLSICLATLLIFNGCGDEATGEPINVTITAAGDGILVRLDWEAPDADEPDEYIVYFKASGTTDWVEGATVESNVLTYTHDPNDVTGDYMIAAVYGEDEFDSEELTTIPVHTGAVSVSELNAAGNSGYGWDLADDFTGSTYSMTQATNAPYVDFYVTDFAPGTAASDWYIASPDLGPTSTDSTVVPAGNWRTNRFSDPITDPEAALPEFSPTTYFNWTMNIEVDPTYIGVYLTDEEHYGLVKFSGVNTGNGTIQAETWFQTVQGLRLLAD
jgi:hypothetical protein